MRAYFTDINISLAIMATEQLGRNSKRKHNNSAYQICASGLHRVTYDSYWKRNYANAINNCYCYSQLAELILYVYGQKERERES
jgi:hypothetical protein